QLRRPPTSPPFPYPTLFRSSGRPLGVRRRPRGEPHLPALSRARPSRRPRRHPRPAGTPRAGLPFGLVSCVSHIEFREVEVTYKTDRKSTRLNSSHVKISYAV